VGKRAQQNRTERPKKKHAKEAAKGLKDVIKEKHNLKRTFKKEKRGPG